jgi:hypothetical protein
MDFARKPFIIAAVSFVGGLLLGSVLGRLLPFLGLYEFFREMQTLIVGVVGFGGVIATMVVNEWTSKRAEEAALKRKKDALKTALVGELKVLQVYLKAGQKILEDEAADMTFFTAAHTYATSKPMVYEAALPDLGILSLEQVSRVVNAYSRMGVLAKWGDRLLDTKTRKLSETHKAYGDTLARADNALKMAIEALEGKPAGPD